MGSLGEIAKTQSAFCYFATILLSFDCAPHGARGVQKTTTKTDVAGWLDLRHQNAPTHPPPPIIRPHEADRVHVWYCGLWVAILNTNTINILLGLGLGCWCWGVGWFLVIF